MSSMKRTLWRRVLIGILSMLPVMGLVFTINTPSLSADSQQVQVDPNDPLAEDVSPEVPIESPVLVPQEVDADVTTPEANASAGVGSDTSDPNLNAEVDKGPGEGTEWVEDDIDVSVNEHNKALEQAQTQPVNIDVHVVRQQYRNYYYRPNYDYRYHRPYYRPYYHHNPYSQGIYPYYEYYEYYNYNWGW